MNMHNTGVAHCPLSNMKLASAAAPVVERLDAGINVGLGSDEPARSNNDFNMFDEMDPAEKLQKKLVTGNPQALPARIAIQMATIELTKVLGLAKETGSLEAGKRADPISISLDSPNALSLYDIESQIVCALEGSDVRNVLTDGRLVVRDRKALALVTREVKVNAQLYGKQVSGSLVNSDARG